MSDRRLEQLFERFRVHGDVDALGQVFDATAPALRRVARHLTRDTAEAEDLVQATFLAAIEKRATFEATRELNAWLTGILLKQASLARRARARAIEPDRLAERSVEDPLDAAAARELSDALTVALARLSPSDRDIMISLLLDGRRAVEIARELGARPDTVHMRIHRALDRLRRLLPTSLASIALVGAARARGLSAVRVDVMRHARIEFGGGAIAAGTVTGVLMTTKQIAMAVALAILVGVGGWRLAVTGGIEGPAAAQASPAVDLPQAALRAPRDANERAPATAVEVATAGSLDTNREFEVTVLHDDGRPAIEAFVALQDSSGRVRATQVDENGQWRFPSNGDAMRLFARAPTSFPQSFDVAAGARSIEVRLARGAELSGRLVPTNGALPDNVHLRLWSDSAPLSLAGAGIEVYRALDMIEFEDADLVAHAFVGVDGAFRFELPDENWSGMIRLPSGLVFADAGAATSTNERVFARPTTGLTLEIATVPRIVGRIVHAASGAPVANARFDCLLRWSNGNDMMSGDQTGPDGRFMRALEADADPTRIEIVSVHMAGQTGTVARVVEWSEPADLYDAGDIPCTFAIARRVEFCVRGLDGKPLAGARAAAEGAPLARGDDNGCGAFHAVRHETTEMRVVAPGHAIAVVPLDKDTATPIDVVLAPTNRLTIELPPGTRGIGALHVILVSRPFLFGGTTRMYDELRSGDMVGESLAAAGSSTQEGWVKFAFDRAGRIELEGIATGVTFRARLEGWEFRGAPKGAMDEVFVAPLGPEEQRRIVLVPDAAGAALLHTVRGRARDEHGRGLHRANVEIQVGERELGSTLTGVDGTFEIDVAVADGVDVLVAKRGYVAFRARQWRPDEGVELDALLARGRDLRVELVDAQGRPVGGAEISATVAGLGSPWLIEERARGVHVLCDVPPGPVEFAIELAGKSYTRSFAGAGDVTRFELPGHGRIEVRWRILEPEGSDRTFQVALRPIGFDGTEQRIWTLGGGGHERHTIEAAWPGEYTLGVEVAVDSDEGREYVPLVPPQRVTIRAGETVRVEL